MSEAQSPAFFQIDKFHTHSKQETSWKFRTKNDEKKKDHCVKFGMLDAEWPNVSLGKYMANFFVILPVMHQI